MWDVQVTPKRRRDKWCGMNTPLVLSCFCIAVGHSTDLKFDCTLTFEFVTYGSMSGALVLFFFFFFFSKRSHSGENHFSQLPQSIFAVLAAYGKV